MKIKNFTKSLSLLIIMAFIFCSSAFSQVQVGTGTLTDQGIPIEPFYGYTYSQQIYLASEINASGTITHLRFQFAGTSLSNSNDWTIYIGHTSKTEFTGATDWIPVTSLTQVYSSTFTDPGASGWIVFDITDWVYNGVDNIVIAVDENATSYNSSSDDFYCTATPNVRAITYRNDVTNPDPTAPPTATYAQNAIPNIIFNGIIQTCPVPSNLMASSSPAGTAADLDWTTGGSSLWNIEYGPAGFTKGTGTVEAVSIKPHTISGLTIATDYEFYVQDSCGLGDLSAWVGPYSFTTSAPPLNGLYTIGDTAGGAVYDFPSFSSAARYLSIGGVSGQVTFNVASGVYNEQVYVDTIIGASPTNTVTFQAATGNAADVELTYESTISAENYTVLLEGAKYLRLKNLTISAAGTSYARVIELRDSANYNIIDSCIINGANTSSTSTNYAVIYKTSSTGHAEFNTISNNQINNGSYGIYYYGSGTTSLSSGIVVESNNLSEQYYSGIYLYYLNAPIASKNEVYSNSTSTSFYGIYAGYCDNALEITKNTIEHSQSGYGIYLYYCDGTSTEPGLIANNMISYYDGSSTLYGIYHAYSNYKNYYHNTVNVEGTSASTRAMYVLTSGSYSDLTLTNNILSNSGNTGYAIYFNSTAMTNVASDYNVFYAPSATALGYYGSAQADLAAWQTTTGFDANSHEINPHFIDNYSDLHITGPSVDGKGTPIASVLDDIDGDLRNATTPDIGADEYTPLGNDIGVVEVTNPVAPMTAGVNNVEVVIQNFGANTITSATIEWEVDGLAQTAFSWSGSILPYEKDTIILGTYNFVSGTYHIQSWTSNPNSSLDEENSNDTIDYSICTPLSGIYSIGSTGDYNSFMEANAAMINCGIIGDVVFNVMSGVYNEQLVMNEIPGASSTSTVTFQAATGNAADVELTYESTISAENYTVLLEGAKYLRLKNLTISATGSSYATVIELKDSANYNVIDSCILNGANTSSTSTNYAVIYKTSSTGHAEFNTISNNQINNGSYGMYYYGSGTTSLSSGLLVENNSFTNQYNYGIRLYYLNAPIANQNKIISISPYTSFYGIYAGYCDNALEITKNKVEHNQSGYGIYLYYCDGTSTEPGLIANNMISYYDGSSTLYGIYHYYSNYQNYYHNTVNVEGTSSATRAMYVYTSGSYSDLTLTNNILSNSGNTGYAIYFNSTAMTNVASDYNVFYAPNATGLGYYGSTQADLAAWQTATSFDANSVEDNPVFANIYLNNLTPLSSAVDNLGTPIAGITTDIYNNPRSATTPDIGAVEYNGYTDDLSLVDVKVDNGRCLSTNDSIFLTVHNLLGSAVDFSVNNLRLVWDVTGPAVSTDTITITAGTLAYGLDTVFVGSGVDLSVPGVYTVSAYLEANTTNPVPLNDTLINFYTHVVSNPFIVSPKYDTIYNPEDTTELMVISSYFESGDFFITEICHWAGATTGEPTGGQPSYLGDDYVEITGAPGTDLGGFTFEKWTSSGSAPNVIHTFPSGTILNAQGTYLLSTFQGTTSLGDYHQVADVTSSYSSTEDCLNILKNQTGDIVDAVLYGTGSTIPAAAGVTTEWTGAGTDGGSSWGIRLIGADTDDNTNWVQATQDPNVLNTGVTNPTAPPAPVGFSWSYNGSVTSTLPDTVVGPYMTNGTYEYAAAFTDTACGLQVDTAYVHVAMPFATTSMTAQSVCIGDSLELFVDLTGTAPWTLIVTDGTGNDTIPGITTSPYGIWVYPTAQTTTYKAVKVFDANGWNYSNDSIVVTLDSLPTAEYSYAVSNVTASFAEVDFTDISVNADSVKYNFGDGITSTQANPTHNYTSNGTFNAYQVAYNQCGTDTFWLDVIVSGVSIEDFNTNYQVDVYPNPNNGRFTTDIYVDNTEKAALHILTMEGRKVYAEDLGTFNGRKTINIDIDLPKGVYFVQIQMLHGNIVRKLIIQ